MSNKDQQLTEIKKQFDNMQQDLQITKKCLGNLISWLVMEIGKENAKTLLGMLDETNAVKR